MASEGRVALKGTREVRLRGTDRVVERVLFVAQIQLSQGTDVNCRFDFCLCRHQ